MRIATVLSVLALMCGCAATPKDDVGRSDEMRGDSVAAASGGTSAGQAAYDTHCGSCHRLGDYDVDGAVNLARHARHVEPGFLGGHHGSSLSAEEVVELRAFIVAQ